MGICSGAYHAWRAALAGVDVQQVVVINPVVFHWKPGMSIEPRDHAFGQISITADARRGLRDPARWLKLLKGQVHVRIIIEALVARARHTVQLRLRDLARLMRLPLTDDLATELALTAARGVSLDFVFSCNEPGLVLLREETGHKGVTLERDNLVKVSEIAHADHTFAGTVGRDGLYARLDVLLNPAAAQPMNSVSPTKPSSGPVALRP